MPGPKLNGSDCLPWELSPDRDFGAESVKQR